MMHIVLESTSLNFDMLRRSFPGMLFKGVPWVDPFVHRWRRAIWSSLANLQGGSRLDELRRAGRSRFRGRIRRSACKRDVRALQIKTRSWWIRPSRRPCSTKHAIIRSLMSIVGTTGRGRSASSAAHEREQPRRSTVGIAEFTVCRWQARLADPAIGAARAQGRGRPGRPDSLPDPRNPRSTRVAELP